jgi:hypothetical protein
MNANCLQAHVSCLLSRVLSQFGLVGSRAVLHGIPSGPLFSAQA